jgi:uncharacterized ferritin-like protein (DUF455 family)
MSILAAVETCLFESEIDRKLSAVDAIEHLLDVGADLSGFEGVARSAQDVVFPEKPTFVNPRDLKRRSMSTEEGLKVFLHAVAHIEFTAILLALDAAYRFRQTPDAFRRDWLLIAVEEARHYRAVVKRMNSLSASYGDFPAHRGLWELAESTSESLIARMALVPRFMEARGLDVTPGMIDKFSRQGDQDTVEVLSLILREEIGHVAVGTQWFKWACTHDGVNPEDAYFDLVDRFLSGGVRGPFNREARIQAGFSEAEMQRLESLTLAT